jgi:hypothetical protein
MSTGIKNIKPDKMHFTGRILLPRDPTGVDVLGKRLPPEHLGDPVIGRIESLQVEARRNKTRLNKGKWLGQWSTKHLHC